MYLPIIYLLPTYLPIIPSVHPSVHLSIHLCIYQLVPNVERGGMWAVLWDQGGALGLALTATWEPVRNANSNLGLNKPSWWS